MDTEQTIKLQTEKVFQLSQDIYNSAKLEHWEEIENLGILLEDTLKKLNDCEIPETAALFVREKLTQAKKLDNITQEIILLKQHESKGELLKTRKNDKLLQKYNP